MNEIKRKEKQFNENLNTQNSTSTDFTKKNKMLFYKTISSNFSQPQINDQKSRNEQPKHNYFNSVKKSKNKKKIDSQSSKYKTINKYPNRKRYQSIISLNASPNKENEKKIESPINSLLPTNINLYHHLICDRNFGIFGNLNWALRLRDYNHKGVNDTKVIDYKDYYYRENNDKDDTKKERIQFKHEKIKLTDNFNPPSYYEEDLNKYKKRRQIEKRSLITELNPNYNRIRHLLFGNNNGNVNYSQFNFESTLRNIKYDKTKENKKWQVLPVVNKSNKKITKFLDPITPMGIQNLRKIEKYLPKNYEYNLKDLVYGNDKIKKKIIFNNRNYTISGAGETLGDEKYDNKFGDNNMFANLGILTTATNQQCKFELGLRQYGSYKDKKSLTQHNFRPKKKLIKKGM